MGRSLYIPSGIFLFTQKIAQSMLRNRGSFRKTRTWKWTLLNRDHSWKMNIVLELILRFCAEFTSGRKGVVAGSVVSMGVVAGETCTFTRTDGSRDHESQIKMV